MDSRTGRHRRLTGSPAKGSTMNSDGLHEHQTIPFDPGVRRLGVAVGFDGSPHAAAALAHGAAIAARRGVKLSVISTYRAPLDVYFTYAALPPEPEAEAKKRGAQAVLDEAAKQLADHPGEVSYLTAEGDSVGALVEASGSALLMVVGARGRGGFLGRILGSVAAELPAHARCPVIVVPSDSEHAEGPVVVGLDGSLAGRRAALHAAQAAVELGTSLRMLAALQAPRSGDFWAPAVPPAVTEAVKHRRAEVEEALGQAVNWVKEHVPSLEVTGEVLVGDPAELLHEAGRTAQLVVVGSRGRGAVASALLGSVSRATLHGAKSPVMVVPPLEDSRMEGVRIALDGGVEP